MTKKIVRDDYVSTFKENQQLQFSSHENSEFENNHVQNVKNVFSTTRKRFQLSLGRIQILILKIFF